MLEASTVKNQLKYEQLKRMLLEQVTSGRLQPGDMLPPEVELAQQMGVARNTVRQAMRELELQNVIRRVRGKGTIICEPAGGSPVKQAGGQLYGFVLPELRAGMYQSLQAGMANAMSAESANMIVCDSGQDLYQQIDVLLQLVHRGVSGVAMVPITSANTPIHHVSVLKKIKMPLVFCHRRIEGIPAPLVGFSPFDMGHVAAAALAEHGHKRVAMIFSHRADSAVERIRGAREAIADIGGQIPDELLYFDSTFRADPLPPGLEDRLTEQLKAWLSQPSPPTGIIVSADRLAAMTCLALQKLGKSVPGDVSVIGFGDRSNRNLVLPVELTSVTVDEWKLGQLAFETLAQIHRGERPIDDKQDIWMPLEVNAGASIGPIPNP